MAEVIDAPELNGYKLPPPGNYPKPPVADYPAVDNSPATVEPTPHVSERLAEHIGVWRPIAALALLVVFILAATIGGFEIAHLAIAVGCFALAGTSGLVGVLLGWENERLSDRVRDLEGITALLIERGNRRGRG